MILASHTVDCHEASASRNDSGIFWDSDTVDCFGQALAMTFCHSERGA
ncbi:MAG: hypothetical protein HDT11_05765 [Helicobacter sp.]|nr:hypothetical protein [Helicobacter sp.]